MKRTPLKRGKPLARGTSQLKRSRMKRKPTRVKPGKSDRAYSDWLHTQKCRARNLSPCRFGIEQHHKREDAGGAAKSHDHDSIALCLQHHRDLHSLSGAFRFWKRQDVRDFVQNMIAQHRGEYLRTTNVAASAAEGVF